MDACGEDITKMDETIAKPFRTILTYLSYITSKNNMIEAIRKEQEQQSKYKR